MWRVLEIPGNNKSVQLHKRFYEMGLLKNNIQLNLLLQTPLRVNSTRLYDIRTRLLRDESKAVEQQGVEQEEKGKVMREEGRVGDWTGLSSFS